MNPRAGLPLLEERHATLKMHDTSRINESRKIFGTESCIRLDASQERLQVDRLGNQHR